MESELDKVIAMNNLEADHRDIWGKNKNKNKGLALKGKKIRIVFDGPPGPEGGRFIEVVGVTGESFQLGEWVEAGEYWYLEIPDFYARIAELEAAMKEMRTERNDLGAAIRNAAVKAGICRPNVDLTGPLLVMLCDDMVEQIATLTSERDTYQQRYDDLLKMEGF